MIRLRTLCVIKKLSNRLSPDGKRLIGDIGKEMAALRELVEDFYCSVPYDKGRIVIGAARAQRNMVDVQPMEVMQAYETWLIIRWMGSPTPFLDNGVGVEEPPRQWSREYIERCAQ